MKHEHGGQNKKTSPKRAFGEVFARSIEALCRPGLPLVRTRRTLPRSRNGPARHPLGWKRVGETFVFKKDGQAGTNPGSLTSPTRSQAVSSGRDGDGEQRDFSAFFLWPTKWQPSFPPIRPAIAFASCVSTAVVKNPGRLSRSSRSAAIPAAAGAISSAPFFRVQHCAACR